MSELPSCFFDNDPGTVLLEGVYFCTSHAICQSCLKPLTTMALTCRCDHEGYSGHVELLWCSDSCRDAAHPDYEPAYEPDEDDEPTPDAPR